MDFQLAAKPTPLIITVFILTLLSACGGVDDNQTTQGSDPLNKPLSEVKLPDPALQNCLQQTAQALNYQTVGQVEVLRCNLFNRIQLMAIGDFQNGVGAEDILSMVVRDTTGINQFTQLRELNLAGGLYTSIDIKPLKHLQNLNLSGSFLESLDLGEKPELHTLSVSATVIDTLDLSELHRLDVLSALDNNSGYFTYYDDFISMLSQITDLDIEQQQNHVIREIYFKPGATLKVAKLSFGTLNNLEPSDTLKTLVGRFTPAFLLNSSNLEQFQGQIQTAATRLDFSSLTKLQNLNFSADTVSELVLPEALKMLSVTAPILQVDPGNNTTLVSLEVNTPIEWSDFNTSIIGDESFTGSLESLSLTNYFMGRLLDVSAFTSLTSLTLLNSYIDIALYIPDQLENLTMQGVTYATLYSDANLNHLSLDNVPGTLCSLEDINAPNTQRLHINNCDATSMHLKGYDKLTSLTIINSQINSIDLSPLTALQNLFLPNNQLSYLDLSPFNGEQKNNFDARNNLFDTHDLEDLRHAAESIFSSVSL